jgi:predicted Zn finger-like uncharacterized protein
MFTRCPACATVHPVNASLLARDGGRYRCGKCQANCNALDALYDDWPEAGQKPAAKGELPVLGVQIDLEEAGRSRLQPEDAKLTGEPAKTPQPPKRIGLWLLRSAWIVAGVVIGAIIIVKVAEWSGHPVLERDEADQWMARLGLAEPKPGGPFRDLEMIHLVSRQLTADPSVPDTLRLQATIVNRASRSQPYPSIEVVLFDAEGNRITDYDFEPGDYLARDSATGTGMSPHAYLPLDLELEDPGVQAVGFELNFR